MKSSRSSARRLVSGASAMQQLQRSRGGADERRARRPGRRRHRGERATARRAPAPVSDHRHGHGRRLADREAVPRRPRLRAPDRDSATRATRRPAPPTRNANSAAGTTSACSCSPPESARSWSPSTSPTLPASRPNGQPRADRTPAACSSSASTIPSSTSSCPNQPRSLKPFRPSRLGRLHRLGDQISAPERGHNDPAHTLNRCAQAVRRKGSHTDRPHLGRGRPASIPNPERHSTALPSAADAKWTRRVRHELTH